MAKRLQGQQRKDLLRRYRQRIDASRKMRQKGECDALWKRLIDLYRGKHFETQMLTEHDRIAVNVCFSTVNVIAPSVAVNHPKLVVWAKDCDCDPEATIVETVLNYWWRHFKVQKQMQLAVKDWLVIGHAWLKVGWRYVEEEKVVAREDDQDDATNVNSVGTADTGTTEGVDMENHNSLSPDLEPKMNNAADVEDADEMEVAEDRPFVERVSPFDIYVDPEATTEDDMKWVAQKIVKPMEEVRNDPKYRRAARRDLKPDGQINPDWLSDQDRIGDDIKRVTVWEFYDLKNGTMCVFPELGDEFLVDPMPQPYAFGHPFIMIRNYEVPDFFYPMGEIEALEPLQLELDKTRTQLMNHRKRYNRKYLYRDSAFDARGVNTLMEDTDNLMVPVISQDPLMEVIVPLKQEALNPELYQYVESIEADMDRVSGVSEYDRGALPEIRRTATEATMIQDAANARASDKLAQVENVIARTAERVVQLMQQYMTQDQVARTLGPNGKPVWIPYSREDIQGEFDFIVEAGSTQPKNDTYRRQTALQMLQTFEPFAQAGLVNIQELLRYTLNYGFDIKDTDKFLAAPQAQPQGEQQPSPKERIIESINYKDLPPDIQRQLEQAAGFQPSTMGGSSPMEGHLAKIVPQQQQQAAQGQQQMGQALLQHAAAEQQQERQHGHEERQMGHEHGHEHRMAQVDHVHEAAAAHQEHRQAMQQQQAAHEQAQEQAVLGAAVSPQPQQGGGGGGEEAPSPQPQQEEQPDPRMMQLLEQLRADHGMQQYQREQ